MCPFGQLPNFSAFYYLDDTQLPSGSPSKQPLLSLASHDMRFVSINYIEGTMVIRKFPLLKVYFCHTIEYSALNVRGT